MAEAKFKRGSASNLASLAKEDGSVIFAVKDASSPTTLVFDKTISGTVQRLGVAVSNAATSNYAATSSTANLAKNSNALSGKVITSVSSGTSAAYADKIPYINTDGVMEVSRYIDFHGDSSSRDFSLRFDTGNASQLSITGPSASTVIANYFSGNAKNSNALGGSSLAQVLSAAGSGKFLPLAGGTMTGTITAATGNQKGIKIGSQWITSANNTNGEVVLQGGHLRFGTTAWDYNQWAGLKYNHSNKGIYLGIADGSQFTANSPQSGGSIYTPGIDNIYVGASTSQKVLTTSNYTSTTDGRYVKKAGDTMSGNLLFSNSGTVFRGIQGQVGDNDYWRVMGGATGSNAGFLEIATGDDSNEPIYARQYSGAFATLKRTLTLMDASGHTRLYGNLLLNRSGGASLGRIGYYSPSYYTWFSYMSNPAGGAAPTGGMPSTYSNVTSWAQRSLIENASGYGWIWESASNASAATNVMPTPMMSLSSNNGNLAVRGTVISPYFNGLAKNSNALGGSSLSQILTAAGGGNSFTAIDTATNSTVKLTRANGGTVAKIINNVSNASSASYANSAANASTANYAKSAPPTPNSVNYVRVYNSSNVGDSSSVTVNDLSKKHFAQGMIYSATDNPLGKAGWVHVQSMAWTDGSDQWASQIAFDVQNGTGAYYRSSSGSGHLAGRTWNEFLDSSNYTSYAADRTAFTGASVSGRNVIFTRANGGTTSITTQDTTYPVYGKTINAGFSTAFRTQAFGSAASGWRLSAIRNNTAGVSNAPQHGSGIAWANADTHGYLYVSYPASSPQAFIGGGSADKLNWIKQLAFIDSKMATASTADYAKTLEGHPASYFAVATGTSSNVVENGMYLLSNTSQVNNRFSVKNGQLTSGNTNFPSNLLLAAASTDYPQLVGDSSGTTKNYSILHFGNSAYRHDIVMACSGTNTGIIYAFATTANTGGRLARLMDSLNYSGYMYRFDNQITFSKGLIANSPSSTVLIDGGSY